MLKIAWQTDPSLDICQGSRRQGQVSCSPVLGHRGQGGGGQLLQGGEGQAGRDGSWGHHYWTEGQLQGSLICFSILNEPERTLFHDFNYYGSFRDVLYKDRFPWGVLVRYSCCSYLQRESGLGLEPTAGHASNYIISPTQTLQTHFYKIDSGNLIVPWCWLKSPIFNFTLLNNKFWLPK